MKNIAIVFSLALIFFLPPVYAASAENAVQAGRDAFQQSGQFPWYDSANDSLRRIDPASASKRTNGGRSERDGLRSIFDFAPSIASGFLQTAGWLLLITVFIALVGVLVWSFLNRKRRPASVIQPNPLTHSNQGQEIEYLPFGIGDSNLDLLGEARSQYKTGNFSQAMIYLFSYQLLQLDKYQQIRLMRGKTNRQYLFQIRTNGPLYELVRQSVILFEDVFFGNYPLSRARFEICWQQLDEFHLLVQQTPRV